MMKPLMDLFRRIVEAEAKNWVRNGRLHITIKIEND